MKQVVQNYRTGDLWLEDVPDPICRSGGVVVRNEYSVVSTGTERMKVEQARMSLLEKAKARPDQVKKVLGSIKQQGIKETFNKVQERLDALTTLGYSSIGIIEEVGSNIDHLKIGNRVVCAGEGIACHAERIFVPKNLCALVQEGVDPREAAFATVGAIAMNGIRQAGVSLGDTVAVIGLGLVGLLAVQILKAAGCRVTGIDIDEDKLGLALDCGAEAALGRNDAGLSEIIQTRTQGRGFDCVYIAASANSSDPMELAGNICRDRANIVIVGMVPIEADWRTYYAKEVNVILSRSYGPGRYDKNFEDLGIDYPVGYIPWTEKRNLEEFVRLVGAGLVTPTKFGAEEVGFSDAPQAYAKLHKTPNAFAGGILFRYEKVSKPNRNMHVQSKVRARPNTPGQIGLGMIGAGNFATGTLIPALKQNANVKLQAICSAGGLSAKAAAKRHGFEFATSDVDAMLSDDKIDAVVIATRHDTHARFAKQALLAEKHAFVEKPIALSETELDEVVECAIASSKILMPGFNRRFSPLAEAVRNHFSTSAGPLEGVVRINAGVIESDSWYQDANEGGWRIVSEGCHWIDLLSYLLNSAPVSVSAVMTGGSIAQKQNDNCIANIEYENGSIATLCYLSNGDSQVDKERIEVFGQGKVGTIENWRYAKLYTEGKSRKITPNGTGKGHTLELANFVSAVRGEAAPLIDLNSAYLTSLAALRIKESMLQSGVRKAL